MRFLVVSNFYQLSEHTVRIIDLIEIKVNSARCNSNVELNTQTRIINIVKTFSYNFMQQLSFTKSRDIDVKLGLQ